MNVNCLNIVDFIYKCKKGDNLSSLFIRKIKGCVKNFKDVLILKECMPVNLH